MSDVQAENFYFQVKFINCYLERLSVLLKKLTLETGASLVQMDGKTKHYLCLCHLLIIFANSLDSDQARQNVGPDLDPNCLTLMVFLKEFFEKDDFEKKTDDKKA